MADFLVCGTLAFDLIGRFDSTLGPATRNIKLHQLAEGFGGCAMNVAYNLARLGHRAVPLVYVGADYAPRYRDHVRRSGMSERGIFLDETQTCARGFVFTGFDDGQFTAFYPGPTGLERVAQDARVLATERRFDAAILAPDLPAKTLACIPAIERIPLRVWCPGQYAEHLEGADARRIFSAMSLVIVNRHEWEVLQPRLRYPARANAGPVPRVVVTAGPEPVQVAPDALTVAVPPVARSEAIDPTGCGDAFAAGLTAGLLEGLPIAEAIRAGSALAASCLRHPGAQSH